MIHPSPRILAACLACLIPLSVPQSGCAADAPVPQEQKERTTAPDAATFAGRRVLVLGDSITQDGRWVSQLETLLRRAKPEADFDIVSIGLASETLSGLSEPGHAGGAFARPCVHERLGRALERVKPALVVACYGMNDGIFQPFDEARFAAFRQGVEKLAAACRGAGAELILVTPPIYEGPGPYAGTLDRYAAWEVASPPQGVRAVLDLHSRMAAAAAERRQANPAFRFTTDQVHPGPLGHLVMARAVAAALGVPTPGTPEEQLAAQAKDPLFKLVSERRQLRSNAWLNAVGYVREKKVPPGTGDLAAAEAKAAQLEADIRAQLRQAESKR